MGYRRWLALAVTAQRRATLLPGGAFAAALYLSYIVTCDNSPVADWLVGAGWASLDGPLLVFSGPTGARLGALRRTDNATAPPSTG